jgi:Tol biopolymer transport system component
MIGRTVDRYHVVAELGRGGMGVVYKARDTLLDRFVALKVLPPERGEDPLRRQRFLQEAKAASALDHPGIVAVHDVRQVDGQDVLVMEHVSGETLERRMASRALPLTEALGYAAQIADAVSRAHAAGIVHRDLKPSNVMITDEGRIKVLDFGLAKLTQPAFPDDEGPTLARDPSLTDEGLAVGTIAYMSPEQACGKSVDARSDVFSFGVMLYEMLTGRHPFRRGSSVETLAAIRAAVPEPPTRLKPDLPVEVERAVLRCLHSDPRRRWQSLSDLGAVLEDLREDSSSGRRPVPVAAATPERWRRWLLPAALAVVSVAAVAGGWLWRARVRGPAAELPALERLTYDSGFTAHAALSADGKLLAYASDRGGADNLDIWVQHTQTRRPVQLTHDPADDWLPSFSPDGSRIAFRSERDGGGIYVVDSLGGGERRIVDGGLWPHFSPDGSSISFIEHVAWRPFGLYRMFLVSPEGGAPRPLASDFGSADAPRAVGLVWSPDGRFVLFVGARLAEPTKYDWWVAPVAGGKPVATHAVETLPGRDVVQVPATWTPGGLLYLSGSTFQGLNLFRVRIGSEAEGFRVSGTPERLVAGPGMSFEASVAAAGRVALSRFNWVINIVGVALDSSGRATGEPSAFTHDAAPKFGPALTRDGSRLAYTTYAGPREERRTEIEVLDLASGEKSVPVSTRANRVSLMPHFSPGGALLSWVDTVDRRPASFVTTTGSSAAREVCRGCSVLGFLSEGVAVASTDPLHLVRIDLASGVQAPLAELGSGMVFDADATADGRWLAVSAGEPEGSATVHVVPVRDSPVPRSEWTLVKRSPQPLGSPRWSPDGRLLYYLSSEDGFGCIWAQPFDRTNGQPSGAPFVALHLHRTNRRMMSGPRGAHSLAVAPGRLVFNAAELTGNVYALQLPLP